MTAPLCSLLLFPEVTQMDDETRHHDANGGSNLPPLRRLQPVRPQQNNNYYGAPQQNNYYGEPQRNNYYGGSQQNNYYGEPQQNYRSGGQQQNSFANEPLYDYAQPVKKKKKKKKDTVGRRLRGFFPEKGDGFFESLRKIVFLGALVAIVICGYLVADYYLALWKNSRENKAINEIYIANEEEPWNEPPPPVVDDTMELLPSAQELLDINSETVGYLTIPSKSGGDPIVSLPVVQARDNDKYLTKGFYGDYSIAGTLFLDWRCKYDKVLDGKRYIDNSGNQVVYGHNMNDGSMFGILRNYKNDAEFYGEHPLIQFNSNYAEYTYKIFSFFIVDAADQSDTKYECWNTIDFNGATEFYDFVNEAKKRSLRLNDVDLQYGDKLLTLSTCNTIFGKTGRGRLIIMARMVRTYEDPYEGTENSRVNPNIKWPNLCYEYGGYQRYNPDAEFVPYGPAENEEQ